MATDTQMDALNAGVTGQQVCTECRRASLPYLVNGHGKCRYHWIAGVSGRSWADECAKVAEQDGKPPVDY